MTPCFGLLAALLAQAASASAAASGGTRGERRAEVGARAAGDDFAFALGAAESSGPQAARREELIAAVEASAVKGELRVVPGSARLFRIAGEAGVHFETWGLVLGARTGSIGRMRLRAAFARLELERELGDNLHGGMSAAVWLLQLDAPRSTDPWNLYGRSTLDWPQRWESGAWISRELGIVSLAPSLSFSQPPSGWEARASLGVEVQIGPAKLRGEAAAAKQWGKTDLWMFDVSAGLTLTLLAPRSE